MKSFKLVVLFFLVVNLVACAKKQIVKPSDNIIVADVVKVVDPVVLVRIATPDMRGGTEVDQNIKTIYFDFDKADLKDSAREALKANADYMKSTGRTFCIEGHCDERGTVEYNLALGQRRAIAVVDYYKMLGVSANNMATISYGSEKPTVAGTGEEVWVKNRRVETKIINVSF